MDGWMKSLLNQTMTFRLFVVLQQSVGKNIKPSGFRIPTFFVTYSKFGKISHTKVHRHLFPSPIKKYSYSSLAAVWQRTWFE